MLAGIVLIEVNGAHLPLQSQLSHIVLGTIDDFTTFFMDLYVD